MYIPKHFRVSEQDEALDFLRQNSFGQLISSTGGRLLASHVPFLVSEDNTCLLAHLAKPNPQWQEISGQEVLATFQGPHDYISPSWYDSPGVPTWNYQAVHVYGSCALITEAAELRSLVDALTDMHESAQVQPWQPQYDSAMLKGIIGLRIRINEIQCQYKLSQNRSVQDRENVISQLERQGSLQLAAAMKTQKDRT